MKKLLVALSLITALTACGGSDSKAIDEPTVVTPPVTTPSGCANASNCTEAELEVKFNLPPEPTDEEEAKNLFGADTNNNDISDKQERAIVFTYYKEPTRMNLHNELAKSSTRLTKAYEAGDVSKYKKLDDEVIHAVQCSYYFYHNGLGDSGIDDMHKNTYKRLRYLLKRDAEVTKSLESSGVYGLTEKQKSEICPKFKK